jgi:hypothetical protein
LAQGLPGVHACSQARLTGWLGPLGRSSWRAATAADLDALVRNSGDFVHRTSPTSATSTQQHRSSWRAATAADLDAPLRLQQLRGGPEQRRLRAPRLVHGLGLGLLPTQSQSTEPERVRRLGADRPPTAPSAKTATYLGLLGPLLAALSRQPAAPLARHTSLPLSRASRWPDFD